MATFADKVAIVTGAGGSIGGHTALTLATCGARLSLVDNDQAKLDATVQALLRHNTPSNKIAAFCVNSTNRDDIQIVVDETTKRYGKIDILVNADRETRWGTLEEVTVADVDVCLESTRRAFVISQIAAPHLIKNKGCIVNVVDITGITTVFYALAQCTAQAALVRMTKILAAGFSKYGVRVNGVAVGLELCNTDGVSPHMAENVRMSIEGIPLGRTGTLEEVAKVILSLASDTHSFTTGVIIPVDGAFTQTIFTSPDIRYPGVEDKE